jgi:hypothetical protein
VRRRRIGCIPWPRGRGRLRRRQTGFRAAHPPRSLAPWSRTRGGGWGVRQVSPAAVTVPMRKHGPQHCRHQFVHASRTHPSYRSLLGVRSPLLRPIESASQWDCLLQVVSHCIAMLVMWNCSAMRRRLIGRHRCTCVGCLQVVGPCIVMLVRRYWWNSSAMRRRLIGRHRCTCVGCLQVVSQCIAMLVRRYWWNSSAMRRRLIGRHRCTCVGVFARGGQLWE